MLNFETFVVVVDHFVVVAEGFSVVTEPLDSARRGTYTTRLGVPDMIGPPNFMRNVLLLRQFDDIIGRYCTHCALVLQTFPGSAEIVSHYS